MVKYILILALLIVLGTIGLWIFLEHKYKEEELVERVEPDLQDMFEEIAIKRQQKPTPSSTSLPEVHSSPAPPEEEMVRGLKSPTSSGDQNDEEVEASSTAFASQENSYKEPVSHNNSPYDTDYELSHKDTTSREVSPPSYVEDDVDDQAQSSSVEEQGSLFTSTSLVEESREVKEVREIEEAKGLSSTLKEGLNMLERAKGFFKRKREVHHGHSAFTSLEALMRPPAVKTIAFLLRAPEEQPYTIREILEVAAEQQLHIGEEGFLDYLTATHYGDEPMYSVAHMLNPGTFRENGHVIQDLEMEVPGILLFSQIPGPDPEVSTIDHLIRAAAQFGNALGGTLYDESEQTVDRTSLERIRQEIDTLDKREWDRVLS